MDRSERLRQAIREALEESIARDPLDALADLEILDSFVDDYAQARIDDARAAGASWAQIAERLGVSRQAAHKRFGKKRGGLELRLVLEKKKP
jgi:DNA invertase Pin-like site-specific DNA recombinase